LSPPDLNDLIPIRCSVCGRFHGFHGIKEGIFLIRCHNCKNWTLVMAGAAEALTAQQILGIIRDRT